MRAERQRLHRADRYAERRRDVVGEAGGVEHAGLAEHAVLRELRGELRQRRHLVQRVGHDDDHGVRRVLGDVLGDAADDLGVDLEQVHAAHAGLARQAGGDDDDVGAGGRLVAAALGRGGGADDGGLEALDRARLVEVERQALGLALDDVGEHDGLEDVVLGEALGGGGAVEPGPDDGDLAAAVVGHAYLSCSDGRLDLRG